MITNIANTYRGVRINIDNQSFTNCKFENCTIEYGATGPFSLVGCSFNGCQWVFVEHAQNTLNFMHIMYHKMGEFGKNMIEATFKNIQKESSHQRDEENKPNN